MLEHQKLSTAQFEAFANLPENSDRRLEFHDGEIVDVPSNPYASKISMRFGYLISRYLDDRDIAHVTGEAGGYRVFGERYAPDVAVLLKSRQETLADEGYNPIAPDLAVEVEHPVTTESAERLTYKVANYLAAGTTVWVAYPSRKQIAVYAPGQPGKVLGLEDALDGGDVLPGLSIALKDIFKD
jgi:Uma2 family endonuclease